MIKVELRYDQSGKVAEGFEQLRNSILLDPTYGLTWQSGIRVCSMVAMHSTAQEVADFCRSVFVLANQVLKEHEVNEALDALSVALKRNGFEYTKTSDTTVREWLLTLYQYSKRHGATIASVISKVAKVL